MSRLTSLYVVMVTPLFRKSPSVASRIRRVDSSKYLRDSILSSSAFRFTSLKSLLYERSSSLRCGCRLAIAGRAPCVTERNKLFDTYRSIAIKTKNNWINSRFGCWLFTIRNQISRLWHHIPNLTVALRRWRLVYNAKAIADSDSLERFWMEYLSEVAIRKEYLREWIFWETTKWTMCSTWRIEIYFQFSRKYLRYILFISLRFGGHREWIECRWLFCSVFVFHL